MKYLTKIYDFSIEKLEKIMSDSYSYDMVRIEAIKSLSPNMSDISEKCRIEFLKENILTKILMNDEANEINRNLIIRKINDELDEKEALTYKTAFINSLKNYHYNKYIAPFENEILRIKTKSNE